MEEICICGHEINEHHDGSISNIPVCNLCRELNMGIGEDDCYHEFKLDNLRCIEQEAKRRNLIN